MLDIRPVPQSLAALCLALGLACAGRAARAQPGDDCNNNGIPDELDVAQQSHDANHNGIPDECDIEITFAQISWPDGSGGYVSFNSDWGRASIVLDPSDIQLLFPHPGGGFHGWLNVMTSVPGGQAFNWAVQNLPIHADNPNSFQGALPTGVWFNLTVPPGMPVQQVHYSAVITEDPQGAPPQAGWKFGVPVAWDIEHFGGEASAPGVQPPYFGTTGQAEVPRALNFLGAPPGTAKADATCRIRIPDDQVEAVDERQSECWPGAISRSLKYLDAQHDTIALKEGGDTATAQEINDKLRTGGTGGYMGSGDTLLENGLTGKERYVNEKKRKGEIRGDIDTRTRDPADVDPPVPSDPNNPPVGVSLKNGADVEIRINWGKNPNEAKELAHIAFVADIVVLRDARGEMTGYRVTIIDDAQGDGQAKNRKTVLTFDKDHKMIGAEENGTAVPVKPGARCLGFVVEKYTPKTPKKNDSKVRK